MQSGRRRKTEEQSDTLFGEHLKAHLQRVRMTQKELAQESLISEATLSRMVKGQRMSSPGTRANVIRILNVLVQKNVINSIDEANRILEAIPTMGALDARNLEEAALLASLQDQQDSSPDPEPSPVPIENLVALEEKDEIIPPHLAPSFNERLLEEGQSFHQTTFPYPLRSPVRRVRPLRPLWVMVILGLVFTLAVPLLGKLALPAVSMTFRHVSPPTPQTLPQDLYHQVTRNSPTLAESLAQQTLSHWDEMDIDGAACSFENHKYSAFVADPYTDIYCLARETSFCNLAIQVKMQIVQGQGGGIFIRGTKDQHYHVLFDVSGRYFLYDQDGMVLSSGDVPDIKKDPSQDILLTLIARGGVFDIYVNQHQVGHVTNIHTGASCGYIGTMTHRNNQQALALFHDLKVWKL